MQPRPTALALDLEPVPPVEPALSDCCTTGCTPCIFDLYQDALERHEAHHAAWRARQCAAAASAPPASPTSDIDVPEATGGPDALPPTAAAGTGPAR